MSAPANPAISPSPLRSGRLLGDVGGTNIRLAWQAGPGAVIEDERRYPCADFPGIEHALRHYLAQTGHGTPDASVSRVGEGAEAALGIATPVTGDVLEMTNHPWRFSIRALQAAMGWRRLVFINDFAALALALPDLQPTDLQPVGGGAPVADAPCALLGPGTGLGVSGLWRVAGTWQALAGEGGHATLPAQTEREWQVLRQIAAWHGHVSAERVLSGPGLESLYAALCEVDRERDAATAKAPRIAAAITQAALAGEPRAREALDLFCAFLGTVAGNLALTLGARGGVYIGGGIVPRLGAYFATSPFRERFEAKGRFQEMLAGIPCWVIAAQASPALLGAARALDQAEFSR